MKHSKRYEVCPKGIQPCNMKNRDIYWRRYNVQETLYMGQWCLSPLQSRHLGTSHSSSNHHLLPRRIFLNFINGLKSLPFQRWFLFWEKPKVTGHQIWAVGVWVTWVIWCFTKKLCMRHDARAGTLSSWSCQSPGAHSCSLLNHLNSFCGEMFKLNSKFGSDSLLYSLIHFEYDSHTVHLLTQWCLSPPLTSTEKSSLFTRVHSRPHSLAARLHCCGANSSCYINNCSTFSWHTLYIMDWRGGWREKLTKN